MSTTGMIGKNAKTKSFVVVRQHDGLKVVPSYWAPGYTPGHKETAKEALLYHADKIRLEVQLLQQQYDQLDVLMQEVIAAEPLPETGYAELYRRAGDSEAEEDHLA